MKIHLSVCLATHNEEQNLADCLESIRDIADEIIIVDGASTDKTVAIAQQFKAKVTVTDNPPIFHINKQKAISQSHGEWVLQLDADERVSPELKKEIMEKINTDQESEINGYWIPRLNYFLSRFLTKGGQYPDYTLRLYKNGTGRLPARDVHEQAVVDGKIGYLKNNLIHLRDTTFAKYLSGLNRYTDIIATQLQEKGIRLNPINFIKFFILLPHWWFLKTYIRHKGFVDGFPGFIFAFFSSLRFPISFTKAVTGPSSKQR